MIAPKSDFIDFDDGLVHLATGGQPPLLKRHQQAFEQFAHDKSRGTAGYNAHWEVGEQAKILLEQMTGLPARDHAFVGSASEGIARVVSSLEWRAGDNVVVSSKDYPSGRFSFLRLQALGVEARIVEADGWYIDPDRLIESCDTRTRLVYLSHVTSLTGQRFDLTHLSNGLTKLGVALLVDASHSLGVVPVDAQLADFTVCSGYKYLCATHLGILAWNRERQPEFNPLSVGWASGDGTPDGRSYTLYDDARRAQVGNPNHLDIYILETSLRYLLGFGIDTIATHVYGLAERLHQQLGGLGLEVVTPGPPAERAGNIAFADADDANIVTQAAKAGILLWDGDGRVRSSIHLFNTEADIDRYIDWLASRTSVY